MSRPSNHRQISYEETIETEQSKIKAVLSRCLDIFPFPNPYESQIDSMREIVTSLIKNDNLLLQSPTGTGKTLMTFCASLAFIEQNQLNDPDIKVVVLTRTTEQINGFIKEINKIKNYPDIDKYAILSGRNQLCLKKESIQQHFTAANIKQKKFQSYLEKTCKKCVNNSGSPEEKKADNNDQNGQSNQPSIKEKAMEFESSLSLFKRENQVFYIPSVSLTDGIEQQKHECLHYEILKPDLPDPNSNQKSPPPNLQYPRVSINSCAPRLPDIEDIKNMFLYQGLGCPYFHNKIALYSAKIVFCSYIYLINNDIFEAIRQIFQDKRVILIFDEAHNILDQAESIEKKVFSGSKFEKVKESIDLCLEFSDNSLGYEKIFQELYNSKAIQEIESILSFIQSDYPDYEEFILTTEKGTAVATTATKNKKEEQKRKKKEVEQKELKSFSIKYNNKSVDLFQILIKQVTWDKIKSRGVIQNDLSTLDKTINDSKDLTIKDEDADNTINDSLFTLQKLDIQQEIKPEQVENEEFYNIVPQTMQEDEKIEEVIPKIIQDNEQVEKMLPQILQDNELSSNQGEYKSSFNLKNVINGLGNTFKTIQTSFQSLFIKKEEEEETQLDTSNSNLDIESQPLQRNQEQQQEIEQKQEGKPQHVQESQQQEKKEEEQHESQQPNEQTRQYFQSEDILKQFLSNKSLSNEISANMINLKKSYVKERIAQYKEWQASIRIGFETISQIFSYFYQKFPQKGLSLPKENTSLLMSDERMLKIFEEMCFGQFERQYLKFRNSLEHNYKSIKKVQSLIYEASQYLDKEQNSFKIVDKATINFFSKTIEQLQKRDQKYQKFISFVEFLFSCFYKLKNKQDHEDTIDRYFAFINESDTKNPLKSVRFETGCVTAKRVFTRIQEGLSLHSMILTSGTLKPFDIFEKSTKISFKTYEAPHLIDSYSNVFTQFISQREKSEIKMSQNHLQYNKNQVISSVIDTTEDILTTFVQISDMMKQKGGVVIFFKNFQMQQEFYLKFKLKRFSNKFTDLEVFPEPKDPIEFKEIFEEYKQLIQSNTKNCLLLAVNRGKISEGIDLKDSLCRVVLLYGVPFPPMFEPSIFCKIKYMKEVEKVPNWYSKETVKVVNQAAGRCIRHKEDWGSIFFIDSQFERTDIYENISPWIMQGRRGKSDDPKAWVSKFKQFLVKKISHNKTFSESQDNENYIKIEDEIIADNVAFPVANLSFVSSKD